MTDTTERSTTGKDEVNKDIEENLQGNNQGFDISTKISFALHSVFYGLGRAADKMTSCYSKAFRLDPNYRSEYYKSAGISQAKKGNYGKAINLLETALGILPNDLAVQKHLADVYFATGEFSCAAPLLKKIHSIEPDNAKILFKLGMICTRTEKQDKALKYFSESIQYDSGNSETHYRLGLMLDAQKQYQEAVTAFREAIRLDPLHAKAHQALGFTYESLEDRQSAVACFKKALELE